MAEIDNSLGQNNGSTSGLSAVAYSGLFNDLLGIPNFNSLYYPLSSNPAGYLTSSSITLQNVVDNDNSIWDGSNTFSFLGAGFLNMSSELGSSALYVDSLQINTSSTSVSVFSHAIQFLRTGYGYLNLIADTQTSNNYAMLPNKSGTIALLDDLPSLGDFVTYTGATTDVDLSSSHSISAGSIITKTNGDSKIMVLQSTNISMSHMAEWQDKDYTGIADITDIPTNTSQLTNDSGFITDVSGKMDKSIYDTDNSGVVDNAEKMTTIGRNATASILYKGTVVYISGSTGNRPNFVKAQANSESTSSGTFGVCIEDIAINSDGRVATIGTLDNLDTRTTATHPFTSDTLADGDTLYLSPTTAGYVTNVKPSAPNHIVYVGKVVRTSPTLGTIVYRIQNGYELEELHNVAITSVTNRDILQYESASSLWKNVQLTTAGILASTDKNFVTDTQLTAIGTIGNKLNGYIYKNTTPVNVTGTTLETQVLQVTIPANTFSSNDILKIELLVTKSGVAGGQTTRIKLSTSAAMPSGTTDQIATAGITSANVYAPLIRNILSISGGNIYGYNFTTVQATDLVQSSVSYSSKAFDPTVVNYLYVSITNASSGDTSTLRNILISNI